MNKTLYDKFNASMVSMYDTVVSYNNKCSIKSLGVSVVMTSMLCLMLHSNLIEFKSDDSIELFNTLRNPMAHVDEDTLEAFYDLPDVKNLIKSNLSNVNVSVFDIYDFIDEHEEDPNWRADLADTLIKHMRSSYVSEFDIIALLYASAIRGITYKIFNTDLRNNVYKMFSLKLDVKNCLSSGYISAYSTSAISELKYKFMEMAVNNNDCIIFDKMTRPIGGMESLLSAAQIAATGELFEDKEKSDVYNEFYNKSLEYLRSVDYVSEDEMQGILESTFISYSPEEAYDIIRKTF
mgnify:CR=1 FL=1